jgi:hypothetical protein
VLNKASISGHNGGENTISVGAAPFFNPGENEDFSSTGPVTRLFDAAGNRLSAPVALQKPHVTGSDNVNTSVFPQPLHTTSEKFSPAPNFIGMGIDESAFLICISSMARSGKLSNSTPPQEGHGR